MLPMPEPKALPSATDRKIAAALRASPMTQADIGRGLGISRPCVSARMCGETRFTAAELVAVSDLLGVSIPHVLRLGSDVLALEAGAPSSLHVSPAGVA